MTLEETRKLLSSNGIFYEICYYSDEAAFFRHILMYPNVGNAKPCKTSVIVIHSKNQHKDIELQFNTIENDDVFMELYFGEYSFELFDWKEELLPDELMRIIGRIMTCSIEIIVANDIRRKRWIGDVCYDRDDNEWPDSYYKRTWDKIHKPRSLFEKLFHEKTQYEVYDYENYQCFIKG